MFTNPTALLALSLLVLPVAIHMLARLTGRRIAFPTVRFLKASESSRLSLKKIERWPLLILRLSVCALLVLTVSGPFLPGKSTGRRAVLVLIDSSMSLSGQRMQEQAKERAREAVASLGERDVVAIAQFDDAVSLLSDFTADRGALEQALMAYRAGHRGTDFKSALLWAKEKLSTRSEARELVLISDLQAMSVHSFQPLDLEGIILRAIKLDGPRFNARPGTVVVGPAEDAIEISSAILLEEPGRTTITPFSFQLENKVSDAIVRSANSTATLSARWLAEDFIAGVVTTGLADDIDADDDRFFVFRLPEKRRVLLVQPPTGDNRQVDFIEKAMEANSLSGSDAIATQTSRLLPASVQELARHRIVIAPLTSVGRASLAAAAEFVERGGSLVLTLGREAGDQTTSDNLAALESLLPSVSLSPVDSLESLGLRPPASPGYSAENEGFEEEEALFGSVRFHSARSVRASGAEILMRYSNGEPALVSVPIGAGRLLLSGFGFSSSDSSFAISPVFPDFIEWLLGAAAPGQSALNLTVGELAGTPPLEGATRLTRIHPDREPAREEIARGSSPALDEPGLYEIEYSSGTIICSVNAPAAESSIAQADESLLFERVGAGDANSEKPKVRTAEEGTTLWKAMAVAALLLSLIELAYAGMTERRENK